MNFAQTDRQGRLTVAQTGHALALLRMDGTEQLSGPFEWRVQALSDRADHDLHDMLGTHGTVEINHAGQTRYFDGIICEAVAGGPGETGWRYDLVLRPWLHVAGLRRNMRIFHNKTVIQILQEVLEPYGDLAAPHLDVQTCGTFPVLEYTVQYGESDADFACRQMERHGISWSWDHSDGNHTLVLTDEAFSLPEVPGGARPYRGVDRYHRSSEEHFHHWSVGDRMTTGAVRLTEYNFKSPMSAQEVHRVGEASHPGGATESYDWPGDYTQQAEGKAVVGRRLGAERGQAVRHTAKGDTISLGAGRRVKLVGDQVAGATGQTFVCLRASHRFQSQTYGTGDDQSADPPYEGQFVLTPETEPYLPEQRTAKRRVHGPETAVVVGDGEIDCDEYGRILCRFHWDDKHAYTMRVRVSQTWAGRGWGGMVVPRVGMEVIVEHLRGDPDKPIVTGCVYNGAHPPPAELPANKTRSVFKTYSSPGGEGFNELTFEDAKDEEFIYMHAAKNLDVHVENSAKRRVEFDDNVSVGNASNLDVAADRTETIEGQLNVAVTGNILEQTQSDRGIEVSGDFASRAGGDLTLKAAGEIVLDARKITLVAGGAALTVEGGAVNAAPVLNVGSASPGAAAIPAIPDVLKAAAGAGAPFVSHCPLKDDPE